MAEETFGLTDKLADKSEEAQATPVSLRMDLDETPRRAVVELNAAGQLRISPPAGIAASAEKKLFALKGQTGTLFMRFDEAALPGSGAAKEMNVKLLKEGGMHTLVIED